MISIVRELLRVKDMLVGWLWGCLAGPAVFCLTSGSCTVPNIKCSDKSKFDRLLSGGGDQWVLSLVTPLLVEGFD